jgi:hypothetical protein
MIIARDDGSRHRLSGKKQEEEQENSAQPEKYVQVPHAGRTTLTNERKIYERFYSVPEYENLCG